MRKHSYSILPPPISRELSDARLEAAALKLVIGRTLKLLEQLPTPEAQALAQLSREVLTIRL